MRVFLIACTLVLATFVGVLVSRHLGGAKVAGVSVAWALGLLGWAVDRLSWRGEQ